MIGIDIIPAQPPKGVSTIQGNFLSESVREEVKKFVREKNRGKLRTQPSLILGCDEESLTEETLAEGSLCYVELEKRADLQHALGSSADFSTKLSHQQKSDEDLGRTVDVVLSDMSEPWAQTHGFWKKSLINPYFRMMNTTGINTVRDIAAPNHFMLLCSCHFNTRLLA